jgi:hypothetical protein
MNRRKLYIALSGVVLVAVVALTLVFGVFGDQPEGATGSEAVLASAEAGQSSGGGIKEGIQVHGHWIMEVRETDGTLVSRHEFDNELTDGDLALPKVLARDLTVGGWTIRLYNLAGTLPWIDSPGRIVESTNTYPPDARTFHTLTVDWECCSPPKLILSGTATAEQDGAIDTVITLLDLCDSDVAPDDCGGTILAAYQFTRAYLVPDIYPAPVDVLDGQIVQVTVEISFS